MASGFRRIVVAVDFSPISEWTIRMAHALAGRGATIHLVHVTPQPMPDLEERTAEDGAYSSEALNARLATARADLEQLWKQMKLKGRRVKADALTGSIATALLQHATDVGADLVVAGAHSKEPSAGPFPPGSNAKVLVRSSITPIVIVRPRADHDAKRPISAIGVGTDFQPADMQAAAWATRFAHAVHAKLQIIHVVDPLRWWDKDSPTEETDGTAGNWRTVQSAQRSNLHELAIACSAYANESTQVSGRPVDELRRFATEQRLDLLVVGNQRDVRWASRDLGSVAVAMVESAPCSLLVWRYDSAMKTHWPRRLLDPIGNPE